MEEILYNAGKMISDFDESHFGIYVTTGPQAGRPPIERMIGKVVQVRKEAGMFGSDIVFLRHCTGELCTHENQAFFKVPDEYTKKLDEKFKDVLSDKTIDKPKTTYSIRGKQKRKGFIIPSKIKAGETTPLREVKSRIIEKLNNINEMK